MEVRRCTRLISVDIYVYLFGTTEVDLQDYEFSSLTFDFPIMSVYIGGGFAYPRTWSQEYSCLISPDNTGVFSLV
jgi:hypothetical protein